MFWRRKRERPELGPPAPMLSGGHRMPCPYEGRSFHLTPGQAAHLQRLQRRAREFDQFRREVDEGRWVRW